MRKHPLHPGHIFCQQALRQKTYPALSQQRCRLCICHPMEMSLHAQSMSSLLFANIRLKHTSAANKTGSVIVNTHKTPKHTHHILFLFGLPGKCNHSPIQPIHTHIVKPLLFYSYNKLWVSETKHLTTNVTDKTELLTTHITDDILSLCDWNEAYLYSNHST